ncbi:MAG: hypothetical protein K2I68_02855, partial [Bacteroidales bacterium]|nr:hypothetical protein [Bacteroidales bacterium]
DQFWCVVTSTEGCVLPEERTAVSDTIKIVYRRNTGLFITGDTIVCAKEPVRLKASSDADTAAVKPVYTWNDKKKGASRLVNVKAGEPQTYSVTVTHPDYCDTTLSVTVKAYALPDSLRLDKYYDYVCSQNYYTYRVLGKPEGLTLQWSTGETTDSIRPFITEGDTMFTVSYRDGHGCYYPADDTLRIEVRDARPIHFTGIDIPDTAIYNEDTRFAISTDIIRDSVRYRWYGNGINFTIETEQSFIYDATHMTNFFKSESPYRIGVVLEDYSMCGPGRDTIIDTMLVLQPIYAAIDINANARIKNDTIDVCEGSTVRFFAATAHAGPVFADGSHRWYIEWFRNDVFIGRGDTIPQDDLENGDKIYAVLHCDPMMRPFPENSPVKSPVLTVKTIKLPDPKVEVGFIRIHPEYGTLYYDTSRYDICEMNSIEVLAKIEDGGDNPSIYWYLNGGHVPMHDQGNPVMFENLQATNNLNTNYDVYAKIVSNHYCANPKDTLVTNTVTVEVHPINEIDAWIDSTTLFEICQFEDGSQYIEIKASTRYNDTTADYTYTWYMNGNVMLYQYNLLLNDS